MNKEKLQREIKKISFTTATMNKMVGNKLSHRGWIIVHWELERGSKPLEQTQTNGKTHRACGCVTYDDISTQGDL